MMLGLLLARAGVPVMVLEKHADFLRDFRGDTVHPSTLQVLHELGLLESFLARPHDEVRELSVYIGDVQARIGDFSRLRTRCGFVAMVPQWEFLDFLRDHAEPCPGFGLLMRTEAHGLLEEGGRVVGVRAAGPEGDITIRADLVVAADGRTSSLRAVAGLAVQDLGAPIDVLWMRIGKQASDPVGIAGRIAAGRMLVTIDRGSYWQCAYVIRKGGMDSLRARGLQAFREDLEGLAPHFAGRVEAQISSWDDVKLLSVRVDRLQRWWKPGLLCIGDAAHAMSPIGGVGINLAIQDAVAAANLLAGPLADAADGAALDALLPRVQARRLWPTRVTQAVQVMAQNRLLTPLLEGSQQVRMPGVLKLLNRFPLLRALPAYAVGIGARPEHVRSPQRMPAAG